MSQFPHDEFDDVQPYRQDEVGKHRAPGAAPARGAAGSSGVAKWIGLLVVAVIVAVAVGWFITRDDDDEQDPTADEPENGQEEADPDEENGEEGSEDENGDENGEEESENGLSDAHPVRAVNAGAPDGSAGQLTGELEELGLDVGQSIDWNFAEWGTPTTPQVIYPGDEQQELAEAIAAEFGIEMLNQNESWSTIVVIVGPEYE